MELTDKQCSRVEQRLEREPNSIKELRVKITEATTAEERNTRSVNLFKSRRIWISTRDGADLLKVDVSKNKSVKPSSLFLVRELTTPQGVATRDPTALCNIVASEFATRWTEIPQFGIHGWSSDDDTSTFQLSESH